MDAKDIKKEDLMAVYDNFNKAMAKDDFDGALGFCTEELKKQLLEETKTPASKSEIMQMLKAMVPIKREADHFDFDGKKATLNVTGTFVNPADPAEQAVQEMVIDFIQENGSWKRGMIHYRAHYDESQIKRSPDQNFEPESSYDMDRNTSIGGTIFAIKFEKTYTLVVIRMFDEENLIFLPKKEDLEKSGLKAELLVPGKIIQAEGHPHKTDQYKVLADKAEMVEPNLS